MNPSFYKPRASTARARLARAYRGDESERQLRILWQDAIEKERWLAIDHQHLRPFASPERLLGAVLVLLCRAVRLPSKCPVQSVRTVGVPTWSLACVVLAARLLFRKIVRDDVEVATLVLMIIIRHRCRLSKEG